MKSLIDLKKELLEEKLNNLYIFSGEETLIRKIYCEKIVSIYGNVKYIDTVKKLYSELESKSLFARKQVYIVYNDYDFLKTSEKNFNRLLDLIKDKVVIIIFDELNSQGKFQDIFADYITVFNKVTEDICMKYINRLDERKKLCKEKIKEIAFNCNYSYNNIVEEMNKYNNYNDDNTIDSVMSSIFHKRLIIPDPRQFANGFVLRDFNFINESLKSLQEENILAYLPELYNTVNILLFISVYGKWDGGSKAYNSGEYWGRVKELREYRISYSKQDLLDIRYLLNKLDIDVRSGRIKAEYAWDYLIGVIL